MILSRRLNKRRKSKTEGLKARRKKKNKKLKKKVVESQKLNSDSYPEELKEFPCLERERSNQLSLSDLTKIFKSQSSDDRNNSISPLYRPKNRIDLTDMGEFGISVLNTSNPNLKQRSSFINNDIADETNCIDKKRTLSDNDSTSLNIFLQKSFQNAHLPHISITLDEEEETNLYPPLTRLSILGRQRSQDFSEHAILTWRELMAPILEEEQEEQYKVNPDLMESPAGFQQARELVFDTKSLNIFSEQSHQGRSRFSEQIKPSKGELISEGLHQVLEEHEDIELCSIRPRFTKDTMRYIRKGTEKSEPESLDRDNDPPTQSPFIVKDSRLGRFYDRSESEEFAFCTNGIRFDEYQNFGKSYNPGKRIVFQDHDFE